MLCLGQISCSHFPGNSFLFEMFCKGLGEKVRVAGFFPNIYWGFCGLSGFVSHPQSRVCCRPLTLCEEWPVFGLKPFQPYGFTSFHALSTPAVQSRFKVSGWTAVLQLWTCHFCCVSTFFLVVNEIALFLTSS